MRAYRGEIYLTIDELSKKYFERIDKRTKRLFAAVFIIGILANLPLIISGVNNPDGILAGSYITSYEWDISLGRWGFVPFYMLNGGVVLPSLVTVISIFIFSLAVIMILQLFPIRSWVLRGVVGGILISFPSITQYMTYFYISEAYASSFFLAVLAAYILEKKIIKRKFIRYSVVILILIFSMSIFQSMIGVTIAVWISILLIDTLYAPFKNTLKKIATFTAIGIVSLLGYFIGIRIVCLLAGTTLSDYRGISGASGVSLTEMFLSIPNLYRTFFKFYFTDTYYAYTQWGMHYLFGFLFVVFVIVEIGWSLKRLGENRAIENVKNVALHWGLIVLIPPAFTAIGLLAVNTAIDFKMLPQMMVLLVTIICRLDCVTWTKKEIGKQIALMCICGVLMGGNILMTNSICEGMIMKCNGAISLSNRILAAIDSCNEYTQDMPIAILGEPQNEAWLNANGQYLEKIDSDTVSWGQFWSTEYNITQRSWSQFFNLYHGIILNLADDAKAQEICSTSEFKEMGVFPEKTSMQVIDGVLTIKLSDFM